VNWNNYGGLAALNFEDSYGGYNFVLVANAPYFEDTSILSCPQPAQI
jgi:hypothetical protein